MESKFQNFSAGEPPSLPPGGRDFGARVGACRSIESTLILDSCQIGLHQAPALVSVPTEIPVIEAPCPRTLWYLPITIGVKWLQNPVP